MDQIFVYQQVFEKSWKYGEEMYTCSVDLEKAYEGVLRDKLWAVLLKYDVRGQLLISCYQIIVQTVRNMCSCQWHENKAFKCQC